jgi:hypothetical protein
LHFTQIQWQIQWQCYSLKPEVDNEGTWRAFHRGSIYHTRQTGASEERPKALVKRVWHIEGSGGKRAGAA